MCEHEWICQKCGETQKIPYPWSGWTNIGTCGRAITDLDRYTIPDLWNKNVCGDGIVWYETKAKIKFNQECERQSSSSSSGSAP